PRITAQPTPPILAPKPNFAATLTLAARRMDRPNKITWRHHDRFFADTVEHSGASPHQNRAPYTTGPT
ncbi:MAG TPA: hypothetical protein VGH55_06410, partial [Chthoniobacterales bacterium]